jgi:transposase
MLKTAGSRAHYTDAFKREVVAEVTAQGASVAAVARRHGLNANLLFGWRRDPRFAAEASTAVQLLPVEMTPDETGPAAAFVPIEPRRLQIVFGERVRVSCLEDISDTALQRLARAFGREL